MDESIAELECKIVLIADSQKYVGHIEVVLEPLEPIETLNNTHDAPQNTFIVGPSGSGDGLPPQLLQMMETIPKELQRMAGRQSKGDPRHILYIEEQIQFNARNWHHGDKIKVSFEKISDHA